jgi:hypothetical protein
MAISWQAFSIGHGRDLSVPDHADDSKVARLEHFLGRRSRPSSPAGPKPFDPYRLIKSSTQLTIRFEPDQSALWCCSTTRAPLLHAAVPRPDPRCRRGSGRA